MRKFFGKISKRTKIFLFALLFVGAAGFGIYNLVVKQKNDAQAISSGDSIYVTTLDSRPRQTYGPTNNWSTRAYYVNNSRWSTCIEPSLAGVSDQSGTAFSFSRSDWPIDPNDSSVYFYDIAKMVLLVTESSYDSSIYNSFNNFSNNGFSSWSDLEAAIPEISSVSSSEKRFVLGHIWVSALYSGNYEFLNFDGNSVAYLNGGLNDIMNWFNTYHPGYIDNYAIMGGSIYGTSSDGRAYQKIAWLEYAPTTGYARVAKYDSETESAIYDGTFSLYSSTDGLNANGSLIQSGISAWTSVSVSTGWYCFVETTAPSGYIRDTEPHCGYVAASQTTSIPIYNTPEPRGGVRIMKVDSETNSAAARGIATVDGSVFYVYRTTDNAYMTSITISNGYGSTSSKALAQGSYYVVESSAGPGYIADTATKKYFTIGSSGGVYDLTGDPFTNQIIRGGLTLTKTHSVYGGGTEAFSGITFSVRNNSTGESVQITTDTSGVATTGNNALIYGDYTVTEISNSANEAFTPVDSFTVNIRDNGTIVNAGTKNNSFKDTPNLSTVARNSSSTYDSPNKELEIGTSASVTDRIIYGSSLTTGLSYRIVGELYEVSSNTLISTKTINFTKGSDTYQEMVFDSLNTADFIGKTLGIKQTLYVQNNGTWYVLSVHNANLSDTDQQVKVKDIQINSTTATSQRSADNKKLAVGTVKVIDSIEIIGLVNGTTYQITGELRDASGNAITLSNGSTSKTETYLMSGTTGSTITTTMELEFDSTNYVGQTITVYETLKSSSGTTIAIHPDSSSTAAQIAAQQLQVLTPTIGTTAVNNGAGSDTKKLNVGSTSVKDTISYTGLVAGNVYTVDGELINKSTNTVLRTGTVSFTATGETGTIDMTFSLDTAELYNIDSVGNQIELVVFEYLKRNSTTIATHQDLTDTNQTVGIVDPTLGTTATNNGDGDDTKKLNVGNTSVLDTITYTGLVPGDTYTVKGKLINLDDGSVLGTNEVSFTPTAESGTITMTFSLDTNLLFDYSRSEQAKLVVYENLYKGNYHIGKHENDNDAGQTVQITTPVIQTSAVNKLDNTQKLGVGDMTVKDTITYSGLVEGDWYMVVGTIVVKETGEILELDDQYVRNSTTFKAGENGQGTVVVEINLDTTTIQGKELVAYERLYRSEDKHGDGRILAVHEDLADEAQTVVVKVARVETLAKDGTGENPDGDNVIEPEADQTIVDTVSYEGLMREEVYTLVGTLMNKETEEPLLVDGEKVIASTTFTTSDRRDDGTATVTFTFDATDLPGGEIVVFERLYRGTNPTDDSTPVAVHEDYDDANQYIKVKARIGTAAVDDYDGDQKIGVGDVTVIDTVDYEGLKVGKTYEMRGTLVDKETGDEIGVTSSTRFTVTSASEQSGTVTMTFEFSSVDYIGKDLVVFEELYVIEEDEDGEETETYETEHKDLDDESQTITVLTPRLVTTAVDKIDLDKELAASGIVVIEDKVEYSGLVAGTEYIVKGTLMDRATGERFAPEHMENSQLEGELSFIARGETGTVTLDFQIDVTGMGGHEIVVFEDLYIEVETEIEGEDGTTETVVNEVAIAEHDDLNDQMQTVWVRVISPDTGLFTKSLEGAKNRGTFVALGMIVIVSVGGFFAYRITKRKRFGF